MAFYPNLLTPLQQRILRLVSGRIPGLFLTGGTALGSFYLGHRRSVDIDLFTRDAGAFNSSVRAFLALLQDAGLTATAGQAGPGFRRFLVSDGADQVPVDVATDTAPALAPPVVREDGLLVDSLDDIAANKLTAILGRAEVRDYVDLYFLEREGMDLLSLMPAAQRKDGGLEAATLAFVLSQVKVRQAPEGLERPVTAEELQAFVDDLRTRLARAAFPRGEPA